MEDNVERELTVPDAAEDVWGSLTEPEWLAEDASIELCEAGEVRAGERTGFVEEVEAPHRLVFWWSAPDEDATRVEIELRKERPEPGFAWSSRARSRSSTAATSQSSSAVAPAQWRWSPDGPRIQRTPYSRLSPTAPGATSTRCSASAARRAPPSSHAGCP